MNIALIGYGKMGKAIEQAAADRKINVVRIFTEEENNLGAALTQTTLAGVDVCIDFSTPSAAVANIEAVAACGKNIVVGTTGWYDRLESVRGIVASKNIGLLYAPNFSIGMNLFSHLLEVAADYFDKMPMYDVSLHETHHQQKLDNPSGTALALGRIILDHMQTKKELHTDATTPCNNPSSLQIISSRIGDAFGIHNVRFTSESDTIELVHTATNRSGFALGALIAAEWLNGKKGVFTMNDVLTSLYSR